MPTIKIISDPYHKDISFFRRDEASESWIEINSVINKNSDLIKEKYKKGFFPFIAEELVKLICKEYHEKDKVLELVFEGSEDEYNDLKMICTSDRYSNDISLKKSDRYLENARKILPEIVKEFQEIKPLIEDTIPDSEKINQENHGCGQQHDSDLCSWKLQFREIDFYKCLSRKRHSSKRGQPAYCKSL